MFPVAQAEVAPADRLRDSDIRVTGTDVHV